MRRGDLEYRSLTRSESQIDAFDGRIIRGMPIVYNSLSSDLGGFKERIRPEAGRRTFRENVDVVALCDHEITKLLGRRSSGTLSIRNEAEGVHTKIDPPDTSYARDMVVLIERRDVQGMSFGFRVLEDEWHMEDGILVREVIDMVFREITVTGFPAYEATDVAIAKRSLDRFVREHGPSLKIRERMLQQARATF
jgi:HK97 family phage prohead protease